MDNKSIQISMSVEEYTQFAQFIQTIHGAISGGQTGAQPQARFVTVEDRCQYRWPLATAEHRRRIRDVCLARYREHLGRYPLKLTGHANSAFMIEEEHLAILDRAIDIVRNEVEAREQCPLFDRRTR
jgi:hypothetical protein